MGTPVTEASPTIAIFFVLLFLFPMAAYFLAKFIGIIQPKPVEYEIVIETKAEPKRPVMYSDIVQAMMEKAARGDVGACKWVMENVYKKTPAISTRQPKTQQAIINDTTAALRKLKFQPDEVERMVSIAYDQKFDTVNDLLVACLRKK